jgi:hypothetical protein
MNEEYAMRNNVLFVFLTSLPLLPLLFSNDSFAADPKPVAADATPAAAALPREPWLQPEVLRAAVGIGMTKEQMPDFRVAVTDLVTNRTRAINKVMGRNNVTGLKRKIRVASSRQFRKMDKSMTALLTDEQYPKYEIYRDLLSKNMQTATKKRSGSSADTMGKTASAIDGFSDSQ